MDALNLFLEETRAKSGLQAVALTTADGLLIAGAGRRPEVEWIGAVGAAKGAAKFTWGKYRLQVKSMKIDGSTVFLTVAGAANSIPVIESDLVRLFAD